MSISLSSKLASIQPDQTVSEIHTLLQQPVHVRISWWAKRMVSIEGYTGEVEINTLANKYLEAPQFNDDKDYPLQARITCYNLWDKIKNLYTQSSVELEKTRIYWLFTNLREFRPYCRACAGDPLAIVGEWERGFRKNSLFGFTPEKFNQLWPNAEPDGTFNYFPNDGRPIIGGGVEKWLASKAMVDQALENSASKEALIR